MISPFRFSKVPGIIFRPGAIADLPGIAAGIGSNIILVTGSRSFSSSPAASMLDKSFADAGSSCAIVKIQDEPSPEMIDEAVKNFHGRKADVVIAIGGGSVMDAGKAISAMLGRNESVACYLEDVGTLQHPGTKVPFIAVPTTSGTGSEATKNAVLTRIGKDGYKKSLRHDNFVPDIAIVDPELTISCPPDITAASGMDCFTQLTEAYLSTKANAYTDALAIEGLKAIKTSVLKAYRDRHNIEARTGMSFAALTSGICLANAGLGTVHGYASSIGGLYNIPHGVICGTLMASVNLMNVKKLRETGSNPPALKKYAKLGKIFLEEKERTDDYYISGFLAYLQELTEILNLPRLKAAGVRENDIEMICSATDNKNNPVKLEKDELAEIVSGRF
jgi:alcohol dehydrogenase class IV